MNYDAFTNDDAGKEHIQREKVECISEALLQTVSLVSRWKQFCNITFFWVSETGIPIPDE